MRDSTTSIEKPISRKGTSWTIPALCLASLLSIAAASCCVLPIGLTIHGLGGTWLTVLGPFVEHRAIILVGVGIVLAVAWAVFLLRSCLCPRRRRTGVIFALVWTAFFVAALTAPLWERDAMRAMWAYWTNRP